MKGLVELLKNFINWLENTKNKGVERIVSSNKEVLSSITNINSKISDLTKSIDKINIVVKELNLIEQVLEDVSNREQVNGLKNKVKKISENVNNNKNTLEGRIGSLKGEVRKATHDIKKELSKIVSDNNKLEGRIGNLKGEISNVNSTVEKAERKINNQLNNEMKGLSDDITKYHSGKFREIRKNTEKLQKSIKQLSVIDDVRQEVKPVINRLKTIEERIADELQPQTKQDLEEIKRTVEVSQGKLTALDDIKEIKETLAAKGVSIKQELPAVNEEDEVIKELANYGKVIFEHLTTAARHYAHNREDINNLQGERENHRQQLEKVKEQSHEHGRQEGRSELIRDLVGKFTDLDKLFNDDDGVKVSLVSFLKNNGLEIDNLLSQGNVVEISEENREEFEVKASFTGTGKFKVEKSYFRLGDDIISKAQLKEFQEDTDNSNPDQGKQEPESKSNESNEADGNNRSDKDSMEADTQDGNQNK